jgi:hypothetical protein
VNFFTSDYGEEGQRAIRHLLEAARGVGVLPAGSKGLFWDE